MQVFGDVDDRTADPGAVLVGAGLEAPSCNSTMIVLTPRAFSRLAVALAVFTSSRKSMPWMPAWATSVGVPSKVIPM